MYGSVTGVKDITLEIEPGKIFGFLGPNGAGKTTMITMLLDFLRPTSGQIELFGMDAQADSLKIRSRIGFLAGDMALDRGLTGWQQLEYLGNLRGKFDRDYVAELAKRLDCKLDRKFKTLSRGNKQKVGLIAALMHKPELLILDEPTSGLDPLIQAEFNKLILEHKERGGTTFISSHVLSEVQELCDTVAFIRRGELVAVKPIRELTDGAPKLVRVSTPDKGLIQKLKKLSGLQVDRADAGSLNGTYQGDVTALVKLLAEHQLADVELQAADLESSFMQYYEREDDDA